jgi:hypothetical protein
MDGIDDLTQREPGFPFDSPCAGTRGAEHEKAQPIGSFDG